MPRIEPVQVAQADDASRQLLEGLQRGLGMVPNLFKTMAHSPAVLGGFLQLNQALNGVLTAALREQIALAVAGANACDYCASAHTLLGIKAGVGADEVAANLRGESADDKTRAALCFARAVVDERGWVSDTALRKVRDAGYSDGQVAEIVAVIAVNLFTNYFNHIAQTEIDFPPVEAAGPDRKARKGAA